MKRILCTGNGNELLEQVNGRIFRHVWDERSGRYIAIQEDGASSYAAQVRKRGIVVKDAPRFAELTGQLDVHYESMVTADYDATMRAASNQYGY